MSQSEGPVAPTQKPLPPAREGGDGCQTASAPAAASADTTSRERDHATADRPLLTAWGEPAPTDAEYAECRFPGCGKHCMQDSMGDWSIACSEEHAIRPTIPGWAPSIHMVGLTPNEAREAIQLAAAAKSLAKAKSRKVTPPNAGAASNHSATPSGEGPKGGESVPRKADAHSPPKASTSADGGGDPPDDERAEGQSAGGDPPDGGAPPEGGPPDGGGDPPDGDGGDNPDQNSSTDGHDSDASSVPMEGEMDGPSAEGKPKEMAGGPPTERGSAASSGPTRKGRAVDDKTRYAGRPKEAEPKPLRTDDVSLTRVLTNMTETLLQSGSKKKGGRKRPECPRLTTITDKRALQQWRDKRQKYLREVRLYNKEPGNLPMQPMPIIRLVDRVLWESISVWELKRHHRTVAGEDPNDEEVLNWILGEGVYHETVNRVEGTQISMLRAVKWPRRTTGATHMDRFYKYTAGLGEALRKIPSEQITKHIKREQVKAMCKQVQPSRLWRLVHTVVSAGQDNRPLDGPVYNREWHEEAYADPQLTMEITREMCKYLDGLEAKGFKSGAIKNADMTDLDSAVC